MNVARTLCPLSRTIGHSGITRISFRCHKTSSINYESTQATQPKVQEKFSFEDVKIFERSERRKAPIPPFMKNVMVSVYNRELLAYPEILNKEETEDLDHKLSVLNTVFKDGEKTAEDRDNCLKLSGLYGAPIKLTQGGLAMNFTERIQYLESVSHDISLCKALSEHWVALDAIKDGLSEDVLLKLLPDVMNGTNTIALCTKETISTRLTQEDFRTYAQLDQHGVWRIRGEKICNRGDGYYLVLAKVDSERLKVFLVQPNASGVSYMNPYVAFRETPALLLDQIDDDSVASILGKSRLDTSVIGYSLLRQAIMKINDYIRGKFVYGKPLADIPTIQCKVSEALLTAYAAESMAYFTAGLLDGYQEPDADLEVAMCRAFTTKHVMDALVNLLTIPGLEGTDDTWHKYLDQFRKLSVQDEVLENVNIFIAMTGLHHVSKSMATEIKQMRNPLFHPGFIFKKMFQDRHQEADRPKLTLYLAEHLHPTLKISAENLEYCVLRMKFTAETLMARHGAEVPKRLTELERYAQAGTEILAMTSVLARASRSYCIGVRNAEIEMKLAACFVEYTRSRVQKIIGEVIDGEYLNLDHHKFNFGKKVLGSNSMLVEKATERVFW